MSVTIDITVSDVLVSEVSETGDDDVPEPALLQQWAEASYLDSTPAVASLLVSTADEIQQLNKQYREKDRATNVLSFPMQTPEEVDINLLGDVVLCASVIRQEAEQQSKPVNAHWAHMVVHGMLHLQGYDHVQGGDAEVMEQLEIRILKQLGFVNPYEPISTNPTP